MPSNYESQPNDGRRGGFADRFQLHHKHSDMTFGDIDDLPILAAARDKGALRTDRTRLQRGG